jgi:hypothetical protein
MPLDFDEEAHPGGVPEFAQGARRRHIDYR